MPTTAAVSPDGVSAMAGSSECQCPAGDVLVDDTVGSLALLLLAADSAAAQQGRRHVAQLSPPPMQTVSAMTPGRHHPEHPDENE